jgi:hypothetical protein
MARNRVIYQSQSVYCSQSAYNEDQTTSGDVLDLSRVQSCNYSFNVARQDVNQFGELASIDRIITESPTVSFDTSYYLANFYNEHRLGFFVTPSGNNSGPFKSAIANIIDSTSSANQKNYYILTTKEGKDSVGDYTSGDYESIIGIGNGFMTSYSSEGAVGGLPTVSIGVEGQNMNFVNIPYLAPGDGPGDDTGFRTGEANSSFNGLVGISGESPAINPTNGEKLNQSVLVPIAQQDPALEGGAVISALRPGDITFTLSKKVGDTVSDAANPGAALPADYAGVDIADCHIQSYTLGFDLSRTPIQKLGSKFAFARVVDFPVSVNLSVDAVLADLTTGSLADIIDCDDEYDARVSIKEPVCGGAVASVVCNYIIKGLKVDSESFSSSIGDNKTVSLGFSCQVGGPSQSGVGIYMSGSHNIS